MDIFRNFANKFAGCFVSSKKKVTQTLRNMATFFARCNNHDNRLWISIRVYKRNVINTAVSLDISLCTADWNAVCEMLAHAEASERSGNAVAFRDSLAARLWEVKKGVEARLSAGVLSAESAHVYVRSVMRREELEKIEHEKAWMEAEVTESTRKITLKDFVRRFIAECESGERLRQRSTHKVAASTIRNYKGTLAQLEAFEKMKLCELDWDDMTLNFYDEWKIFFLRKQYSPNTIGRHVKNLKIWLRAAKDLKLTTTTDFESSRFAADHEDVDNVYLAEDRIQEMHAFNPTDRAAVRRKIAALPEEDREGLEEATATATARKNLEEAKDIFVVGCLTGQRVSDYKRVNEGMYRTLRDGKRYLYLCQEKTGKWIYIPIDPRVRAILRKYDGRLPRIIDQKLNERIKIVGHLLGWCEDAGVNELRGMMSVPSGKKFYECIKTHTARRSFATNAYKNGIALSSIMAITGHSTEQMLRKYLKLDNKERAILAAQDFERLHVAG